MKKLLSFIFLTGMLPLFTQATYAVDNLIIPRPAGFPDATLGSVISAVVGFLLIVSAVLAFLFLIMGGIQWITSGGDKAGMEAARNRITAAIVGLIIVAAAWAVMMLVGQFIGFDLLGSGGIKIPTIKSPQ
jgi:hypothetical protein